jgi:hypothetical protein
MVLSGISLSKMEESSFMIESENGNKLKKGEIQHMVIFNLLYKKGSSEANKFLEDGERILSDIRVVQNFQVLRQVSIKNDYDYGFSMIFANKGAYTTYNNHAEHVRFVKERWEKEVTRFLEIDFEI